MIGEGSVGVSLEWSLEGIVDVVGWCWVMCGVVGWCWVMCGVVGWCWVMCGVVGRSEG